MSRRIIILGAPGAGKGTQARRIARVYGLLHVSTGDIFRAHVENKTPIGAQISEFMKNGRLVPDALACEIVAARLAEADCAAGYVLDGFPRSVPQAEDLDRLLAGRGETIDVAINLVVDDEEIVQRLAERRTCPSCGKIYNLKSKPPRKAGRCDMETCVGVELVQRDDDKEETIRERLEVYHETTEPIIAYYTLRGLLRSVGGERQSPDDITKQIEEILDFSTDDADDCNSQPA